MSEPRVSRETLEQMRAFYGGDSPILHTDAARRPRTSVALTCLLDDLRDARAERDEQRRLRLACIEAGREWVARAEAAEAERDKALAVIRGVEP